ncbi:hypothetical protein L1D19_21980 [Vibrio natriegens]|uniref:LPD25 domain-containing protein n=1 Tax=Vibrio natriegens TaxID=691 RepID=UPI001EFD5C1D|nr:LPD25 domain-containing protein [Vibrio natriegens]MCG9702739.1 hypothetical protein [Vibrio natriegens]
MTITPKKIKPLSVQIHWSESSEFSEDSHYDFMDFEHKALDVAKTLPLGGYHKTKVTVFFDNDDTHECRLDLGCDGNDAGFTDHCLNILSYFELHQHDTPWLHHPHHLALIEAIRQYELDTALVKQARCAIREVETMAKAEQEAQEHAKRQRQEQRYREHQQQEQAFQASLCIPEWAKAVIVATHIDHETENGEVDELSQTHKTIILAWSKHKRNVFSELRKACLNHPSTSFLHEPEKSNEHRETHWSGDGYYLTDTKYRRFGWKVRKIVFYREEQKARYVPLGELAIPESK